MSHENDAIITWWLQYPNHRHRDAIFLIIGHHNPCRSPRPMTRADSRAVSPPNCGERPRRLGLWPICPIHECDLSREG
jgi:hypothetical protein